MSAKEVHSFLGLALYYWQFIPKFAKIAQCSHELVHPTSNKHKKSRGQMKGKLAASPELSKPKECQWLPEHQQAFDTLKEALVTAPVLGYPDFNREFMLETDTSLQGLGAVLSQQDDSGKLHVIAYASQSLHPSERSMHTYSSVKLELLALKWAVTEKFCDYLLGSKFHVYTDNSPLAYVRESKLGASQIRCLSELAFSDFTIHYRTGRSNRAANALSRHPHTDEEINQERGSDCNEVEVIWYSSVCKVVDQILNTTKVPDDLKAEAQSISCMIQPIMEEDVEEIKGMLSSVSVLNQVPPEDMAEEQKKDPILSLVCQYVTAREKLKTSAISKIKSKAVQQYLLQFDKLTFKQGVLHRTYINNDVEYHQMIFPISYQVQVVQMLNDGQGHQGVDRTIALCREQFYWNTMYKDIAQYVKDYLHCQVAKGPYVGPKTQPGSIIANGLLDLLCVDFTNMDPSRDGKENVLVLTDAFSKLSQAFVTPNQKALTVAKIIVDKWSYVYGIPSRIHSDKGCSFENAILEHLYSMYNPQCTMYNPQPHHTIHVVIPPVRGLTVHSTIC